MDVGDQGYCSSDKELIGFARDQKFNPLNLPYLHIYFLLPHSYIMKKTSNNIFMKVCRFGRNPYFHNCNDLVIIKKNVLMSMVYVQNILCPFHTLFVETFEQSRNPPSSCFAHINEVIKYVVDISF